MRYRVIALSLGPVLVAGVILAGPKVKVTDDTIDFGKTPNNSIVTHTFWVKSVGDQPLRILTVDPGCGCTQMPLLDSVLKPGDSTPFDIVLSTKGYIGRITKRPSFVTNVSSEPVYLKMYAEMIPDSENVGPIRIIPPRVDVSQFTAKPRRKAKFTIENRTGRDVNVAVADSSRKNFTLVIPKTIKAGSSVEGQITVKEKSIPKDFEDSATFEITGDDRTRLTLRVIRMYRVKDDTTATSAGR